MKVMNIKKIFSRNDLVSLDTLLRSNFLTCRYFVSFSADCTNLVVSSEDNIFTKLFCSLVLDWCKERDLFFYFAPLHFELVNVNVVCIITDNPVCI